VASSLTIAELVKPARLQRMRRWLIPVAGVLTFLLFVRVTFPYDTLARRLEIETQRSGADLTIGSIGSHGLFGVRARDVRYKPVAGTDASQELRFDRVDASPDLLPLILRRTSFGFDVAAYGGTARGHAALSNDPKLPGLQSIKLDASDLDLRNVPLKELAGIAATGRVSLHVDLSSLQPAENAGGSLNASARQLALTSGTVQDFPLPRTSLGDLDATIIVEKGVARIEKAQARGGDIDAEADGTVRLRPLLSLSQADLHVRFRPADRWLNENGAIKGALAFVQNARQPDGAYVFSFSGPISRMNPRPGR
jgi:type II secretion system protein N